MLYGVDNFSLSWLGAILTLFVAISPRSPLCLACFALRHRAAARGDSGYSKLLCSRTLDTAYALRRDIFPVPSVSLGNALSFSVGEKVV